MPLAKTRPLGASLTTCHQEPNPSHSVPWFGSWWQVVRYELTDTRIKKEGVPGRPAP